MLRSHKSMWNRLLQCQPLPMYLMGVQKSEFWVLLCLFYPHVVAYWFTQSRSTPVSSMSTAHLKLPLQIRACSLWGRAGWKKGQSWDTTVRVPGSRAWSSWRCQGHNQQLVPLLSLLAAACPQSLTLYEQQQPDCFASRIGRVESKQ